MTHNIVDPPKVMPETDGKEIRIDLLWSGSGDPYCNVYLDGKKIGCLFGESVIPINEQTIDRIHIHYEVAHGVNVDELRPRLFIHTAD